jgi:hypothetical protein
MEAAARSTKRPLNRCTNCGKTWYPRGGNLSTRCPKCGSSKTKIAGLGILATLGSLFLMLVMGGHPGNHNEPSAASHTDSPTRSQSEDLNTQQLNGPATVDSRLSSEKVGTEGAGAASRDAATIAATASQASLDVTTTADPHDAATAASDATPGGSGTVASEVAFSHH